MAYIHEEPSPTRYALPTATNYDWGKAITEMPKRRKIPVEEKFVLFDSITECARSAATVFAEKRWRWRGVEIPDLDLILRTLQQLATNGHGFEQIQTGRLIVLNGSPKRYGYERPKGV